jgi:hypothetical protein
MGTNTSAPTRGTARFPSHQRRDHDQPHARGFDRRAWRTWRDQQRDADAKEEVEKPRYAATTRR